MRMTFELFLTEKKKKEKKSCIAHQVNTGQIIQGHFILKE